MKKQTLIVGLVLVLLFVSFCGCTEDKTTTDNESNDGTNEENDTEVTDDSNRFFGIWMEEADFEGGTRTMRHTFSSDGTYTFEILDIDHSDVGTWVLEDGNLTTSTSHITIYTYSFSDNDTTLTLTDATTGELTVLSKQ